MSTSKLMAISAIILVLAVVALTWIISTDINIIKLILALVTATSTVIMAITIYQLDITLQQLRFDALNKTYDFLSRDIKEDLNYINNWRKKGKKANEICRIQANCDKVRYVSIAFNRIGYYVYKGFLDPSFIQEVFGGFPIRSFIAIRPYLEYMRNLNEPKDKPWLMRRFYLLIVILCEEYYKKKNPEYIKKILRSHSENGSLVPPEWLHEDIKKWLKKINI